MPSAICRAVLPRSLAVLLSASLIVTMPGTTGWAVDTSKNSNTQTASLPPGYVIQPDGKTPSQSYKPLIGRYGANSSTLDNMQIAGHTIEALLNFAGDAVGLTQRNLQKKGLFQLESQAQTNHDVISAAAGVSDVITPGSPSQYATDAVISFLENGNSSNGGNVNAASQVGNTNAVDITLPNLNQLSDGNSGTNPQGSNTSSTQGQGQDQDQGQSILGKFQGVVDEYKQLYIYWGVLEKVDGQKVMKLEEQINKDLGQKDDLQKSIDVLTKQIAQEQAEVLGGADVASLSKHNSDLAAKKFDLVQLNKNIGQEETAFDTADKLHNTDILNRDKALQGIEIYRQHSPSDKINFDNPPNSNGKEGYDTAKSLQDAVDDEFAKMQSQASYASTKAPDSHMFAWIGSGAGLVGGGALVYYGIGVLLAATGGVLAAPVLVAGLGAAAIYTTATGGRFV